MSNELAEGYRGFAAFEARGASPLYERLALHVAESRSAQAFLLALSQDKRQPNLFFAAVRHVAGMPNGPAHFDEIIHQQGGAVAEVMRRRTTQTNEPGRCAVLLPVLAMIDGPIALIEVGASAGLCLLPDQYGYDYGRARLDPPQEMRSVAPILGCQACENTPLPTRLPTIIWRAGIDLNPLDADREDDVRWLETLVWPEQSMRLDRLRAAIGVARRTKPRIIQGDLRHDLLDLVQDAPKEATLVICHTAVLNYVLPQKDRDDFADTVRRTGALWISNESPKVFPQYSRHLTRDPGAFLMTRDTRPVAWTAPHGQAIHWIDGAHS